jgi:hypothetical protein
MNNKLIAINYRLNRLDEAKKKRLALGLPKEEGAFLEKLPKFQEISSLSFESKEELINRIHPSWLKKKNLQEELSHPLSKRVVNDFLLGNLELPLPPQFISKGPLDFLLDLPSDNLVTLCRFLGLYDISLEMKKIVQSQQIKKIEAAFSGAEILFLNQIQRDRQPIAFIEIGLWNWDGDEKSLRQIVLSRGINRLAKALSNSGGTFLWYLAHRFPIEEGIKFQRFHKVLSEKKIVDILIKEVESTSYFMKKDEN